MTSFVYHNSRYSFTQKKLYYRIAIFQPGVDNDELFAGEKLLQSFSDVQGNHLFGLFVVLVHQGVGPDILDDLFRGERPDAVEAKAVNQTYAGAFKDLESIAKSHLIDVVPVRYLL